jgi:hypothetical protein
MFQEHKRRFFVMGETSARNLEVVHVYCKPRIFMVTLGSQTAWAIERARRPIQEGSMRRFWSPQVHE